MLKSIDTVLGSPSPIGMDLTSKKALFTLALVSKHFVIVILMNYLETSVWPLLWWLYDVDMPFSVFRFHVNSLNFSETKLVPMSYTIFLGSPYSA